MFHHILFISISISFTSKKLFRIILLRKFTLFHLKYHFEVVNIDSAPLILYMRFFAVVLVDYIYAGPTLAHLYPFGGKLPAFGGKPSGKLASALRMVPYDVHDYG